jgi:hypothetical protein
MARLLATVLVLPLLSGSAAAQERSGGSIRAFVVVAKGTRLAIVDADSRAVISGVTLHQGATRVAATADGHRVLVVNPTGRSVTQIDGVSATVTRVFRGFSRPEGLALAPIGSSGFVGSRYAFVTDEERGLLDVLDLGRGRVVSRIRVGARPTQPVLLGAQLWVAHRSSRMLAVVDVSDPARPSLSAWVNAHGIVSDLAAGNELAVYVAYARSGQIGKIEAPISGRLLFRRRVGRHIGHIAVDAVGRIWTTEVDRGRATITSPSGRVLRRITVPSGPSALVPVFGWMAVAGHGVLTLIAVPSESLRETVPVGSGTRGVAFSAVA